MISSAIVTYALLNALERYSNWLISRGGLSVMACRDKRKYDKDTVTRSNAPVNAEGAKVQEAPNPSFGKGLSEVW